MSSEWHQRPPPPERTFAQLFPWRNLLRALMLVLLILAIVMIKRSTGPLLARIGDMWGAPATSRSPATAGVGYPGAAHPDDGYGIRLGPGLAPTRDAR